MRYCLGIDIGSAYSKGVLMDDRELRASYYCLSGGDFRLAADKIKKELLSQADITSKDISRTVATGYGSKMVAFADEEITDISCHSKAISTLFPSVRTIVDFGDLYSKAFRIDGKGNLLNFLLSGKCAGGSARVLKVMAKVLQVDIEDLGDLSVRAKKDVKFNTGCAVFAESEVISRVAEGFAKEDLLAAIHKALSAQCYSLAERLGIERDFALTGGGARNKGLIKAMGDLAGMDVHVPDAPHMTAALGAAILAGEALERLEVRGAEFFH